MIDNVSDNEIKFFRKKIIAWGKDNFEDFPWRYTKNKFHALTAEVMLQRTKADQVLPVFVKFTKKYKKPSAYIISSEINLFRNLGLSWREKQFRQLCKILSASEIPNEKEELIKIPCIGDYIAAAYRSLHLNLRDTIIDSNVVRIYGRFFSFPVNGETRREKWFIELSNKMTPKNNFYHFNYGLIDFSRKICGRKPSHKICPLRRKCKYYLRTNLGTNLCS